MSPGDDHTLHSVANHLNPLGVECIDCGRRSLVPLSRIPIFGGSTKLVRDLRLICSGCGSRKFRSWLFFKAAQTRAFERGEPYAAIWDLLHHRLDPKDPLVVYWKDQRNPFLEPER
jgi:hypothetical protein